ncbi:MAG: hypothetical protein LBG06_10965 [Deltaproteobacteria bacterium]|jgi:hypothetical protein|nr:hypothetical protein [Deltaproteobacteria bacterium]
MDPVAVNELCDSQRFVGRVVERAGRITRWESLFLAPGEAPRTDPLDAFADPGVFAEAAPGPQAGDSPAIARARAFYLDASERYAAGAGVSQELFPAALGGAAEGEPEEALALRLLAFLRLASHCLPAPARDTARLASGLLAFPEREGLAQLHARALATVAVLLLNSPEGGAREADRFLSRLLALRGLGSLADASHAFTALSLRLARPEPPPWGPRPGFGAFGGGLRTVLSLAGRLPDPTLADLPVVALLRDPGLRGITLAELLKIKERLAIPVRHHAFRALRFALGVLEASIHARDGGPASSAAALSVIAELDEDGILDCLPDSGPGAPEQGRLETLALRLGRAFAGAREEDMVGLLLILGARRPGALNTGFWSSLPFALCHPYSLANPGALTGVFREIARGNLFAGDPLALFRLLLSAVLARGSGDPPLVEYASVFRETSAALAALEEAGGAGAGDGSRPRAALALLRELAAVGAASAVAGSRPEPAGGSWPPAGVDAPDGEILAAFRRLAALHADPDGPVRLSGYEGLFFTAYAAALICVSSEPGGWENLPAAVAAIPEDALSDRIFTDFFLSPAFHDIILRTQKAGHHAAVTAALRAAASLPRTPETAGAAAALLRLEIFRSIAEQGDLGPEAAGLYRDLASSALEPGVREDLLDAMLLRHGVSGDTDAMTALLLESAAESLAALEEALRGAFARDGGDPPCEGAAPPEGGARPGEGALAGEGGVPPASGTEAGAAAASAPRAGVPAAPLSAVGGPGGRAAAIAAYFLAEAGDFRQAAPLLFAACSSAGLLPAKKVTAEAVIAGLAAGGAFEDASAVCETFAAFAEREGNPAAADDARTLLGEVMRGGSPG